MLNPKTNEEKEKKDGKWSPTLFCAIMHGGAGVFFLGFVIMPDMMCRHLIKGGQESSQATPKLRFACKGSSSFNYTAAAS